METNTQLMLKHHNSKPIISAQCPPTESSAFNKNRPFKEQSSRDTSLLSFSTILMSVYRDGFIFVKTSLFKFFLQL